MAVLTNEKLESIKSNLFYRSHSAITNYEKFDWHISNKQIDADRIKSSQALMIDFWGCLKVSPQKDSIINHLFKKEDFGWEIKFEYSERSLLNEPRPTQIDVILKSKTHAVIIECKFTEYDGGSCSQPQKDNKGFIRCNGNYEEQLNPANNKMSKCALSGKQIKYWEYVSRHTTFDKENTYVPCPFKKGEYQWMRNICFEQAFSEEYEVNTDSYLVYYESNKCQISKKVKNGTYLGSLTNNIINPLTFQPKSYNNMLFEIINHLELIDVVEKKIWLELQEWMKNKEAQL